MTTAIAKPGVYRYIDMVKQQERTISGMSQAERAGQLGYSSIDDDFVRVYDAQGQARMSLGRQPDATFGVEYISDPTKAPPRPRQGGIRVAPRQLAALVGWDGTFEDYRVKPGNFARVDIHISETPGFIPDGSTVVGFLVAESATLISMDSVTHYVKLVTVDLGRVVSISTIEISVLPEPARQIAAEAVGAIQLAGEIVLASKKFIAGNPNGAHLSFGGTTGLELFNSTLQQTLHFDPVTGNAFIKGEYFTALSGERITINEGGAAVLTIRFYGITGTNHAALYQVAGSTSIVFRSQNDVNGRSGFMFSGPTFAAMSWGAAGTTQYSRVQADQLAAQAWGPVVGIRTDRRFVTDGDGSQHRVGFVVMDAAGTDIGNSVLEYRPKGNDSEPWLKAPVRNSGLVFGVNSLHVSDAAGGYGPIAASAFNVASSREVKDRIRKMDGKVDFLAGIKSALVSLWQYPHERERSVKPGVMLRHNAGLSANEPGELIEAEWDSPLPDGIDHVGPMAEDLPIEILTPDRRNVDLRDQNGWMWGAIGQMANYLDSIKDRLDKKGI